MKLPKTLKTTMYLYKMPYDPKQNGGLLYSNCSDMEDVSGWELLGTKEFDLETPDLEDKELVAAKIEKLNKKRQEILESQAVAIDEIDDHLSQLAKINS